LVGVAVGSVRPRRLLVEQANVPTTATITTIRTIIRFFVLLINPPNFCLRQVGIVLR
jgi:hypothetical protein